MWPVWFTLQFLSLCHYRIQCFSYQLCSFSPGRLVAQILVLMILPYLKGIVTADSFFNFHRKDEREGESACRSGFGKRLMYCNYTISSWAIIICVILIGIGEENVGSVQFTHAGSSFLFTSRWKIMFRTIPHSSLSRWEHNISVSVSLRVYTRTRC